MKTLLLDTVEWDLVLDATGNIALASEPYAIAQDVACAVRLFQGELWYATEKGIPYFDHVLGHFPPVSLLKSLLVEAAMAVPVVERVRVYLEPLKDRGLTGQIQFTDNTGVTGLVNI